MHNHEADMKNANKGTFGQNQTHAQNQGNRGGQLNPNRKSNENQNHKQK